MTDLPRNPDPTGGDLFLKPAEGLSLRREDGSPWPVHGDWTHRTQFVRRRLEDGDLVAADPVKAARAVKAEADARAAAAAAAEAEEKARAAAQILTTDTPAPDGTADAAPDVARKGRRAPTTDE
jgi:hypothetical protein